MKIRILPVIIVLLTSVLTFSQDFKGIKLVINPGHGGHDPANDRFIPETGFWESDGNLGKGLMLRDILKAYGAEIIMTRVTNYDADDLPLSQIVAIANDNNVHWMHANHSNASGSTSKANYSQVLYQGKNNAPTYPEAKVMGDYMGNEICTAHRTTAYRLDGDFDFYGTGKAYLGVFKGLTMPGTLSEGSFHDYIPESWRLMNDAYRKHEAWAIAKGFVKYWGLTPFKHGMIAGIVRDPLQFVSYTSLSTMPGDNKKPLNNITVTLQPGNKVYKGDNLNNGFFLFDSLAPGTYTVTYEAEDFCKESVTVNVDANATTFADKYMNYDTLSAPKILTYSPGVATDSVYAICPISFSFNRKMSKPDAEGAFSISPKVDGVFSWDNSGMVMTFTPSVSYDKSTKYTVTLSTACKSFWNLSIASPLSFSFITKNRNRVILEKTFPLNNSSNISVLSPRIRLQFDAPMNKSSLSSCIKFEAVSGQLGTPDYSISTAVENGRGVIYLDPTVPLQKGVTYEITLDKSLPDENGSPLGDTKKISFTTMKETYVSGNVIDQFESLGTWKNPVAGFSSTGIDTVNSTIKFTTSKKMNGSYSARLAYVFKSDSSGICQYFNSGKPSIGAGTASEFGMWVYGDLSFNTLEYWFYYNGSTNAPVFVDTLNWSGWKLMRIPMSKIPGTGEKLFHSIVIKQAKNGLKSSIIYTDDAQYDIVVPVEKSDNMAIPESFCLEQNFPNPFNPSTTISYQLPENSWVSLKVFDLLGRELVNLVNQQQNAGSYKINFDAGNLTSGVYIYKLDAGKFSQSRKMLLVK